MTFKDFKNLINELQRSDPERLKAFEFIVLKDLFDAIDLGKDGIIDKQEWHVTFNAVGLKSGYSVQQPAY